MTDAFFSNFDIDELPSINLKSPKIKKRLPKVKTLSLYKSSKDDFLIELPENNLTFDDTEFPKLA